MTEIRYLGKNIHSVDNSKSIDKQTMPYEIISECPECGEEITHYVPDRYSSNGELLEGNIEISLYCMSCQEHTKDITININLEHNVKIVK